MFENSCEMEIPQRSTAISFPDAAHKKLLGVEHDDHRDHHPQGHSIRFDVI